MDAPTTIVRARVMHTPRDPFRDEGTLEVEEALAFAGGRVLATGSFAELSGAHADARIIDARGAFVLPGLVDTHVHWPQLGIVGAMGLELLDWLRRRTLPEEARLSDLDYARPLAREFLAALAANGTTSALVFGSHFPEAQEVFFEEAARQRPADRKWPGRVRPRPAACAAAHARRGLRSRPGAGAPLARRGPPALRGQPALLALVLGGDARVVRGSRR